ncbi:Alpha/Beta hydrolase protein [Bisporella sp. PMI_857]|nr:Alpha/Beta hydrolase protein [Bisporella sp. PMI_857]
MGEFQRTSPIQATNTFDGNAFFYTATDVVRRLEFTSWNTPKPIIIAIGYPITDAVYCTSRRSSDLTPPSNYNKYDDLLGLPGYPPKGVAFGGANYFLEIIEKQIMPFVEEDIFPNVPLRQSRKALFGYSLGGLFALNTLFTRTDLFDSYIAGSPSVWLNDCCITHEQEKDFLAKEPLKLNPRLFLTYGSEEQHVAKRLRHESDEDFSKRKSDSLERRMVDNALEMKDRLATSEKLKVVASHEFLGEDHGGAGVCGLQRGIIWFLDDDDQSSNSYL